MNYCTMCSLTDRHPGVYLDEDGKCQFCNYGFINDILSNLKNDKADYLEFKNVPRRDNSVYDCVLMLSGGKDSIYLLDMLVNKMKKRVLTYTVNSPFESNHSHENIEKVFQLMEVDHIQYTSHHAYKKFIKIVFEKLLNSENSHSSPDKQALFMEKIPCYVCSNFLILSACNLAHEMNIPYVIYCADPVQGSGMERDLKSKITQILEYLTREELESVMGKKVLQMLDSSDLPKLIFPNEPPFTYGTYNADKIVEELRDKEFNDANKEKLKKMFYKVFSENNVPSVGSIVEYKCKMIYLFQEIVDELGIRI